MDNLIQRLPVGSTMKRHLAIIYYLLQVLLILMYASPQLQPFVYVRF